MFIPFFLELKAAHVPVSLREYLTLLEGMDAGLVQYDVEGFYFLARTALVKDERHSTASTGCSRMSSRASRRCRSRRRRLANLPEEWLRKLAEKHLTEEEKSGRGAGRLRQADGDARQRLEEQKGRHQGGSKWIGTAGTSPFGAYGYNPEGVRIGQDESRHRRAVKVWDKREFRNLDDTVELGTRNIKVALRRLRRWAREGAAEELDLPGTIRATADHGYLDVETRPERHNAVKLLLFLDVGGSMDHHIASSRSCFPPRAPSSSISSTSTSTTASTRACGRTTAAGIPRRIDDRDVLRTYGPTTTSLRRRRLDEPLRDRACRAARSSTGTRSRAGLARARARALAEGGLAQPGAREALGLHASIGMIRAALCRPDVSADACRAGPGDAGVVAQALKVSGCFDFGLQGGNMLLGDRGGRPLDGTEASDDGQPDLRQLRSAAAFAARLRCDHGLAEQPVHLLDQIPRVLVGHVHLPRPGGDRAMRGDLFQKLDLARADPAVRVEIDPEAERRHRLLLASMTRCSLRIIEQFRERWIPFHRRNCRGRTRPT